MLKTSSEFYHSFSSKGQEVLNEFENLDLVQIDKTYQMALKSDFSSSFYDLNQVLFGDDDPVISPSNRTNRTLIQTKITDIFKKETGSKECTRSKTSIYKSNKDQIPILNRGEISVKFNKMATESTRNNRLLIPELPETGEYYQNDITSNVVSYEMEWYDQGSYGDYVSSAFDLIVKVEERVFSSVC